MIDVNELRKGVTFELEGALFKVLDYSHNKTGRGNASIRIKARNLMTGANIEKTFQSGDRVQDARLDFHNVQYLYSDADFYYFMDNETFEQIIIGDEALGDAKNFLIENLNVKVLLFRDKAIGVDLPNFVNLRVIKTDTWVKGDTSKADYKPATVENGYELRVPPFIEEGELITIDTRTGEYSTRVKG